MQVIETAVGISITNQCNQCQLLDEICPECEEGRLAKDATIAHEIVDNRNIIYKRPWHNKELTESDWMESETIRGKAHATPKFEEIEVGYCDIKSRDERAYPFVYISEWIQPEEEFQIRNEFAPPITNLADRLSGSWFLGKHIMPLVSQTDLMYRIQLGKNEAVCQFCNLTYNVNAGCNNY